MKNALALIMVYFLLFFLSIYNSRADEPVLTIGYLENGLKDLNDIEKQVALKMLAKELTGDSNIELTVFSINSMEEMIDLIKDGKLNYSIVNSYYYLDGFKDLKPYLGDDMWAIQRSHQAKEDYILLVNKDFAYNDINSLAGKRLSINIDYLMSNFYLKYLLKKHTHLPLEKFFNSIRHTKTASQSVLDVFFNKSDVCLVPKYILELVCELNPAVNQGVKIVHQSAANFIPALVLTFNNTKHKDADLIRNRLLTLSDTVRGQEILDLFNIKNIIKIDHDSMEYMLKIYYEYKGFPPGYKYANKAAQ